MAVQVVPLMVWLVLSSLLDVLVTCNTNKKTVFLN
jgi:hypothetical protein